MVEGTCLDVVRAYMYSPIGAIQERLKENGYVVALSDVAGMMSILFLENELEERKILEGLNMDM